MTPVSVLTGQLESIISNKVGTSLHPEAAVFFILVTMWRQYRRCSNVQTSNLSDVSGNAKTSANYSAKLDYQTFLNGAKFTIKWNVHLNLAFRWPCIVINSYNKTNRMHLFLKFIFGIKLYMFRTFPLSIIRSFSLYAQQWYMSYRFADSLLCVQWKTPDVGQRKCPKHVEFYSKNKFEKLVHLFGFIIRMKCTCNISQPAVLCDSQFQIVLYPYYLTIR